MLVLSDDALLGWIGVDLIDRPGRTALFEGGLLVRVADGNVAGSSAAGSSRVATARDRRLDGLLDIVELVFALGARIVLRLAVGILAAVEVDIGIDLIALILLRADKVRLGQRAGVEIDLSIAGDQAGRRQVGVLADGDVLVTGGIKPGRRVDPVCRALAGTKAQLHAAECQATERRLGVVRRQQWRTVVTLANRRAGEGEAEGL